MADVDFVAQDEQKLPDFSLTDLSEYIRICGVQISVTFNFQENIDVQSVRKLKFQKTHQETWTVLIVWL